MLLHFAVSLLLQMLVSTGVTGQHDCSFNGQSYANLAKIPHENGCAAQQCQYGQFVTFQEACGKEIDGNCHRLNVMFEYNERTYQCRKVGDSVYKNEIAIARNENCTDQGKTYQTLEKFQRGDGCREYQCQNGVVVALDAVCEKEIDGNCHRVGQHFEKDGTVYICTSREDNDNIIYENKVLDPQPLTKQGCKSPKYSYKNYEVFTILPLCHLRQCQHKNVKIITQACAFKREDIQCYQLGEQWQSENKTYGCSFDKEKQQVAVDILKRGYGKCKRGEHWYNHLEIHTRLDGCTSVQCQDGKTLPVEEGCLWSVDKKCYELNSVWKSGNSVQKCILTEDGLYRVVQLDENGNPIDKIIPTEAPPNFETHCPALAADIVLVLDSSQSIVSTTYKLLLNFTSTLVSAFTLGPKNVRFGAVVFSGYAKKVFDLGSHDTFEALSEAIQKIPFLADMTNTDLALNLIVDDQMFSDKNGGRDYAPDLVILITDGNSTNSELTLAAANRLKEQGINIIVVGAGNINQVELNGIASNQENVFNISSLEEIFSLITVLSKRTCDVIITPATTQPPDTGCSNSVADIFLLLDSSSGVGTENFDHKLKLAVELTKVFTVSPQKVQIGAVLISSTATKLFDLNKYSNRASVIQALKAVPYLPGDRETATALELLLNDGLFSPCHGARENVSQIVIVLIDGPSADSSEALAQAKRLRDKGVIIIVVGIDNYNYEELVGLSGDPGYVFNACSYRQFEEKGINLASKICEVTVPPTPPTPVTEITTNAPKAILEKDTTTVPEITKCFSGEEKQCQHICTDTVNGFECTCRDGYLVNPEDPTKCDVKPCTNHALADIIYVIDSSESIGEKNYVLALNFIAHLIDSFTIGKEDVLCGAIIFSWDVEKLFDLDDFTTKEEMKKALYAAPYLKKSTLTHKAFSYVDSNNMFGTENGGRDNVTKLLILLTDGKSGYENLTIMFANELKYKGVTIICVGVSDLIDQNELKAVASRPELAFFTAGYEVLETIETEIAHTTCTVIS